MPNREWKPCLICGAPDMLHEPQDDLDGQVAYVVTCTNLSCASNGGTNAHALLKRIESKSIRHEPLFDMAVVLHDDATALLRKWVKELDETTEMTEAQEQQALTVGSALEGVRRTTYKLMNMTRGE